MLAIGYPSNGKTTGELINLKVVYFLTGLMSTFISLAKTAIFASYVPRNAFSA